MSTSATTTPVLAGTAHRSPLLRLQSDERLVALTRRGNQHAFETLVGRYQSRLLAFCRHMLSSREDAEDVLQEVFTAAFNALLADERSINVRPWLYRIARNRSLNHLRRTTAIGVDSMDVHLAEGGISTADKVHKREEFRQLVEDVQELPETQRTALLLREIDALSYDQIADVMETTVPSVKSLLVRARVGLAEAAEARNISCEDVRTELGEVAEGLRRTTAPVRRHVRSCDRCAAFRNELRSTNKTLAVLFPVAPLLLLKKLLLAHLGTTAAAGGGSAAAGGAAVSGAGAGAGSGLAGGLLAGAVGGKAAAGLAAAAIVTAGAVEAKHVTTPRDGGSRAAHVAERPAAPAARATTPRQSGPVAIGSAPQRSESAEATTKVVPGPLDEPATTTSGADPVPAAGDPMLDLDGLAHPSGAASVTTGSDTTTLPTDTQAHQQSTTGLPTLPGLPGWPHPGGPVIPGVSTDPAAPTPSAPVAAPSPAAVSPVSTPVTGPTTASPIATATPAAPAPVPAAASAPSATPQTAVTPAPAATAPTPAAAAPTPSPSAVRQPARTVTAASPRTLVGGSSATLRIPASAGLGR